MMTVQEDRVEVLIDLIFGPGAFTPLASRSPIEQELLRNAVRHACMYLPEVERIILALRYGVGDQDIHSLKETALLTNMTELDAYYIESKALKRLYKTPLMNLLRSQIDEFLFQCGALCRR